MIPTIKTKQDLTRALGLKELKFVSEFEVVNDAGLKIAADKIKGFLRQNRKLHLFVVERT
jgi:hypothetical protein